MRIIKIFLIAFIIIITTQTNAYSKELISDSKKAELFLKASEDYNKENFEQAKNKYEELLKLGINNGELFYNLGNCYVKLNLKGKAILYYLKAKKLLPRNPDLDSNIEFLQNKHNLKIDFPGNDNIFNKIFFWQNDINTEELIIIFLIFWTLFWILFILKLFNQSELIRLGIITFGILIFTISISLSKKISDNYTYFAVVTVQESDIKSSTDVNSTTLFKIFEGTVLEVTEQTDVWAKIRLTDNKKGWIKYSSIEKI